MIGSTLFFALGFLCAGFIALMIAPPIWRRAVNLTRRRIEASVPLTLNEIQADKDRMRAEFAMATRRLEMNIKELKQQAAERAAELGRNREEIRRLTAGREGGDVALTALQTRSAALETDLRQRDEQLQQSARELEETARALEASTAEVARLNGLYEEAVLADSTRQLELEARQSKVEKLSADLARTARGPHEMHPQVDPSEAEETSSADALANEKKKVADLEEKIERMLSTVADREEKLDRREKELARLRDRLKSVTDIEVDLGEKLTEANTERFKLENQVAELTEQLSSLGAADNGATGARKADPARLETRLAALVRENKKLRAQVADGEPAATARLRDQISSLAAEVVAMNIRLDGADSAAAKALEQPPAEPRPTDADGNVVISLADRVRALQKTPVK